MKRKLTLLLALALCIAVLAGCACEHQWVEANCTNAKTCSLCEDVEGEPLGHTWGEATCEKAKTCSVCDATEGEALGHTWINATCETAKTCSVCSKIEGEPLAHTFGDWAYLDLENDARTCNVCGFSEQQAVDRVAPLMEKLRIRWNLSGIITDGTFTSITHEDYYCVFWYGDDGENHGAAFIGDYAFESTIELLSCTDGVYTFCLKGYTDTPFGYEEIDGVPTLLLVADQDGNGFVFSKETQ